MLTDDAIAGVSKAEGRVAKTYKTTMTFKAVCSVTAAIQLGCDVDTIGDFDTRVADLELQPSLGESDSRVGAASEAETIGRISAATVAVTCRALVTASCRAFVAALCRAFIAALCGTLVTALCRTCCFSGDRLFGCRQTQQSSKEQYQTHALFLRSVKAARL